MADWNQTFGPMERAVAESLARLDTEQVAPENEQELPLCGAVPPLDEVLAPVAQALARADAQSRATDQFLDAAESGWKECREKLQGLSRRLAENGGSAVG